MVLFNGIKEVNGINFAQNITTLVRYFSHCNTMFN